MSCSNPKNSPKSLIGSISSPPSCNPSIAAPQMGSGDEAIEIDVLEQRLLRDFGEDVGSDEVDDGEVVYDASFEEMEDSYVKYQTVRWVLYSLLLVLAWGIGVVMLLYLPIRRYVLRKDFKSRKLSVSSNAIVYKVIKPVIFPCFGVLKKEKHVLLPLVADVIIEQGYLQSLFGIHSVRIENLGVRKPANEDVHIQGIANPNAFRKAVLTCLSSVKKDTIGTQSSVIEDTQNLDSGEAPSVLLTSRGLRNHGLPSGEVILQRLEVVESSVKRVLGLIERQT